MRLLCASAPSIEHGKGARQMSALARELAIPPLGVFPQLLHDGATLGRDGAHIGPWLGPVRPQPIC